MALFPCVFGSGGTLSETVLWTNPDPSINFGRGTTSLSDNISNYDYISVEWAKTKDKLSDEHYHLIIPTADFINTDMSLQSGRRGYSLYYYSTYREFQYASDTSISWNAAISGSTNYNDYDIPIKVSGLKLQ